MIGTILTKVALWALPRLRAAVMGYFEAALALVEAMDAMPDLDSGSRRETAVQGLGESYPLIPESLRRLSIEATVVCARLGVTAARLQRAVEICGALTGADLVSPEKRNMALEELLRTFPDLPERSARLLVELAVSRLANNR